MGVGVEVAHDSELTEEDRIILDSLEGFLSDGKALKAWWQNAHTDNSFEERFDLVHTLHRSENSFGVFGEVQLDRGPFAAMGVLDEVFYDRPKGQGQATGELAAWMCEQVKEFVLHYFMRTSDFRLPQKIVAPEGSDPPGFLKPFSMKPKEEVERKGMGFTQM